MTSKAKFRQPENPETTCIYCWGPADTKEHVPPKGLFGKIAPIHPLLTAPACLACNQAKSTNDAFLREALIFISADHSEMAARIATGVHERSLLKDKSKREYWASRISAPFGTDFRGSKLVVFSIDAPRMNAIISDIGKGLHWLIGRRYLPPDYAYDVRGTGGPTLLEFLSTYETPMGIIGNEEVFGFRHWPMDPKDDCYDPDVVVYQFQFYGGINFVLLPPRLAFP